MNWLHLIQLGTLANCVPASSILLQGGTPNHLFEEISSVTFKIPCRKKYVPRTRRCLVPFVIAIPAGATDRGVTSQLIGSRIGLPSTVPQLQESYNTPLEHTPGNPPYPTMKGFPLQPIGKGLGVCSKGVLKQP